MIFFAVFLCLVANCLASFYNEYTIVSRSTADSHIFGYNKDKTCTLVEKNGFFHIIIHNYKNFEKNESVKLLPLFCIVEGCFENEGKFYIWTKKNNKTKIINEHKSVIFDTNYNLARYDYIGNTVWLLKNRTIEIHNLRNIWNKVLKPFRKITLNSTCDDIIVVNNRLFCNIDYIIYVLNGKNLQFYSHSNSKTFSYVLYPNKSSSFVLIIYNIIIICLIFIFYLFSKFVKFYLL